MDIERIVKLLKSNDIGDNTIGFEFLIAYNNNLEYCNQALDPYNIGVARVYGSNDEYWIYKISPGMFGSVRGLSEHKKVKYGNNTNSQIP